MNPVLFEIRLKTVRRDFVAKIGAHPIFLDKRGENNIHPKFCKQGKALFAELGGKR